MKKLLVVIVLMLVVLSVSGCYINEGVDSYERGVKLKGGVEIVAVLAPGRYTDLGWFAKLEQVNVSAIKVEWSDPDLVTRDKQPIGLTLSVTFARKSDGESVTNMWGEYNAEARNDESLSSQVLARIPRVAKAITAQYTLDQMLGIGEGGESIGREKVQLDLVELLASELDEIHVSVLDVGVNNIAPSNDYLSLLEDKANAQVEREVAKEKALTAEENLKKEKAQTLIEVELASRERQVQEEKAKVFTSNPQWFELKRLEALQGVVGENDKFWFVPEGSDITLILSGKDVVPLDE